MGGNFVTDDLKRPRVSRFERDNWENDAIQFARMISELKAVGYFGPEFGPFENLLLHRTGFSQEKLDDLIERAERVWEFVKPQLERLQE